jgi:sulfur transfer protein SufE
MSVNLLTENLDETTIPEKFKDQDTGAMRVQALINSYNELEQKMSARPAPPKSVEEYCIDCSHGLFEADHEVNNRLHAKGLTQEQMQEVYDLAAERLVPMIADLAQEFSADAEVEKLIAHFGGPEQWKEVSRQLLSFGQRSLPADVLDNLSSSYEGVLALHKMMKSGDPSLRQEAQTQTSMDELELKSMMRDPRYWREKDPVFVAKVTEGFKKMYDV